MNQKQQGLIIAAIAALLFGLYPPAAKMAYADGANSSCVVIFTTFARALFLFVYCRVRRQEILPTRDEFRLVVSGGFFQALSVFGILTSLKYLPGPVTVIIMFTHTIMLLLYLAVIGEVQLTTRAVVTTLTALFGLSLVVDVWSVTGRIELLGIALAFGAAIATASRLYVFGKQVLDSKPAVVGARVFIVAALFTLLLVPFSMPHLPVSFAGLAWLTFCGAALAIGTYLMFLGIAYLGSFQFSLMVKIEPIFTALFSFIIIGEILHPAQYFGMVIVLSSLAAFQYLESRSGAAEA